MRLVDITLNPGTGNIARTVTGIIVTTSPNRKIFLLLNEAQGRRKEKDYEEK